MGVVTGVAVCLAPGIREDLGAEAKAAAFISITPFIADGQALQLATQVRRSAASSAARSCCSLNGLNKHSTAPCFRSRSRTFHRLAR